jgi:hypothetical protein
VINAPTTFLPWSNRLVDGSFWIKFDTATHAHLRSEASAFSIYNKSNINLKSLAEAQKARTLCKIGRISFDLEDDSDAEARPFGRWESGTRIGLCLRITFFFCDLPMLIVGRSNGKMSAANGINFFSSIAF